MALKEDLFKQYSKNLELVFTEKHPDLLDKIRGKYMCPICFQVFSIEHLVMQENFNCLTEEHIPPKSVQWKRKALTCKHCNNDQGGKVDGHLSKLLHTKAFNSGIEGTSKPVTVMLDNKHYVNGAMTAKEDGQYTFEPNDKRSNPSSMAKFHEVSNAGELVGKEVKWSTGDKKKNMISMIRAAYLWGFADLGYAFILNGNLDKVREQILFPDRDVYWRENIIQSQAFDLEGLHIVMNPKELGTTGVVMQLTASGFTDTVCVLLPGADDDAIGRLENLKRSLKNVDIEFTPITNLIPHGMLTHPEECMEPYYYWVVNYPAI